ncbi:MAG TPA: HDIG domain-containing protein [Gemmatimonadaceae bacterium]|nr:HDIG domain-containing protein [Gemmatimonadaceae bacterium]
MDARRTGERPRVVDVAADRRERLLHHAKRVLLLVTLAVITYLLFPTAPAVDVPIYEVGAVAQENVIAPFGFAVRKSDAELAKEREELARSAKPIFVYVPAALDSSRAGLRAFMAAVSDAAASTVPREAPAAAQRAAQKTAAASVQRAAAAAGVSLTPQEAEYLAIPGRRNGMADALRRVYDRWLPEGVATSTALDDVRGEVILRRGTVERNLLADDVMTFGTLLSRARMLHPEPNSSVADALYIKLLSAFFHPSVVYDRAGTERRRSELRSSVSVTRYQVQAGEKIIGEHEVVGREEHDKLRALHDALQQRTGGERSLSRIAGAILYNALVLAIFGIAVVLFRPQLYQSYRALSLFALVFLVVMAGAALASHLEVVRPELVPIGLAAVVLSVMFDPRISMIASMILAVLVGGQGAFRGTNALFINLIVGAAAAISVRVIRRRDQSYLSILVIALAYLLSALAIGLTLDWPARAMVTSAALGAANALFSVALAMMLIPLAERFTHLTTDLTLLEYSDLNRDLLKRLMREAPGTFAHTMRVANLVEAACNAVGANGLLGRVGTYYHDIGKLKKPQYFVENQARGQNPHDKLKPQTSAAIIRNHVREGIELAQENHLPPTIVAFIPEHHGTVPISFFLEKAKERDGAPPNPAEFVYPGPVPQSAETAILMLADGVEAATHVLAEPTPERIREVIERIVKQRIDQGQLRDAPLTLKQIDLAKEQFARVLIGMHHTRVDYPVSSGGITSEFAAV